MCTRKRGSIQAHVDPVNLILVTSGTRGQKLLFRYPFNNSDESPPLTPTGGDFSEFNENTHDNPYKLLTENVTEYKKDKDVIQNKLLFGYEDALLATTLSPSKSLCNEKFKLKIGTITFVGYPVLISSEDDDACYNACIEKEEDLSLEDVTISMVHVVLVFKRENIAIKVLENFHTLSKMLGMALRHEETRCSYLRKQREIMMQELDMQSEHGPDYNSFEAILEKSSLAQALVKVFNSIVESGVVKIRVNGWISLNYSFPHKVHKQASEKRPVDAFYFNNYYKQIKPYHTFLLFGVKERDHIIQSVPLDASPVLVRLIKLYNPMKSFQVLSQDADIALPQIFQIVGHLVYWGKCNVIYPLAESNVYVISEHAHTPVDCKFTQEFVKLFPHRSLHSVLAKFSFPVTLGDYRDALSSKEQQQEKVQIVTWLLKRRLLKQLHTYVYLKPQQTMKGQEDGLDRSLSELHPPPQLKSAHEKKIFASLSHLEQLSVLQMCPHVDEKDLSLFLQTTKYLRGQHHLEEIMYYENRSRSDLLILIDKFRNLLITVQHEDLATSQYL